MKKLSILLVVVFSVVVFSRIAFAIGNCPGNQIEWFYDGDQDDYGDPENSQCAVHDPDEAPANYWITDNTDCDDTSSNVNPGATEVCSNATDDDCNGFIDELKASDYSSIQDAIDATQTTGCNTVLVSDGTYNETIDFKGYDITVVSENGAASTTITYTPFTGTVVTFDSNETSTSVLDGFTIADAHTFDYAPGGIYCGSGTSPTIKNCAITGNDSGYHGAGVKCDGASPSFINCNISDNTAGHNGAGIYITKHVVGETTTYSSPTFTDCIIDNNSRYGIAMYEGSTVELTDCDVTNSNISGIACSGSTLSITGGKIQGNYGSANGGGLVIWNSSTVDITGCDIISNTAVENGAGMQVDASTLTLDKCYIRSNTAQTNGGGIYASGGADTTITNSVITGNDGVNGSGGGIYATSTSTVIDLTNSTIADNTSKWDGSGISYVSDTTMTIINSIVWGNACTSGTEEIAIGASATMDIDYSDFNPDNITGSYSAGDNNKNADPLFNKDENSPYSNKEDYYIITNSDRTEYSGEDSPCIDVGYSTSAPADDIKDVTRPQGTYDDMGAYENDGLEQ